LKQRANAKDEAESGRIGSAGSWRRCLIYRTTTYKTTWKLRLAILSLVLILAMTTRGWWGPAIGWGLVTDSGFCEPDLILIDNLDIDYLLFEKAEELMKHCGAATVLVPVTASGQDPERPGLVPRGIAEVMIRVAHLESTELLPIREIEPITLNAARQVGEFLKSRPDVHSVLIVTGGFKSKRMQLIFSSVLGQMGVVAYCFPVWGTKRPENWTASWHGVQEVLLQYLKLAYYRALVL